MVGGANVCLTGSITDATATPGSAGGGGTTGATDAMIVYPTTGHNFMLRVNGNYNRMNQKHDGTDAALFYEAAQFPTAGDADIFLFSGGTSFDWRGYAADGMTPLDIYNEMQYNDITFPSTSTIAGVLGIYGNYEAQNADIYTNTAATEGGNNNGVIEVGPATTGQQKFHISSGGIIKNFSSACNPHCDSIQFVEAGNVPFFKIAGTEPLSVLNTGRCKEAAILLATAGVAGIEGAVNGATATGDMLIQAYGGQVEVRDDIAFAPAANHNNVAILSDRAYIKTKAFGYTAAGGDTLGHVTLWAKGLPTPHPLGTPNPEDYRGGYVLIDGNLTTSSTSTPSSWQNLYSAVQKNSENLAKFVGCSHNEEMSARTQAALTTGVQTRIQSDYDGITVTGNFAHTGQDGGLFVQGAGNVTVNGTTTVDFTAGTGDAVIQSKGAKVVFGGAFTYKANETTDLFIDGETGVNFNNGSLIDYTQGGNPSAHTGIQANSGTIEFSGSSFTFKNKSTGNTQLWAGENITNTQNAPLLFDYTKVADGQHIDWYAGNKIVLDGTLTFKHDDAPDHTGMIALRAFTNKDRLWAGDSNRPGEGVCPQRCPDGVNDPIRGDIDLNNAVTVLYKGTENVWMAANRDVNINHNYVHVAGDGQTNQGFTRFVAGNNITTGKENETTTSFNYLHKGDVGHFDMKAGNDIITHNKVKIGYAAAATDVNTTLYACRNIDIRNAFTYADSSNNKQVRLFANQDILTNYTCLNYGAPVNFWSGFNVKTEWNAGRNIITGDTVNFHYGETNNTVEDLSIVAQGGNIEMKRWTNIDYDSDKSILFSAERNKSYSKAKAKGLSNDNGAVSNGGTPDDPRFLTDGHLYFNDSLKITRTNEGTAVTGLYADYHIRTAMVDISDRNTANSQNRTEIESHLGDLWLGYSSLPDICQRPPQTTPLSYDNNRFTYKNVSAGHNESLVLRAGYQDPPIYAALSNIGKPAP